jgi:hypothetical protein
MITIISQKARLEQALARLAAAAKVDLAIVIKQEGGLLAKTIMQITPPTGEKSPDPSKAKASGLSLKAKAQGENAIKGDLFGGRKIAKEKSIGLFQRIGNSTLVPPRGQRTETVGVNLGWERSKKIRIYKKFWKESASISEMKSFHRANLNERGRPKQVSRSAIGRWQVQDQMWVSNQAADAYLAYVQKSVGLGKAGFAAAAIACGIRVPAWIKRHASKAGSAQVGFGSNPFVIAQTSGNQIPNMQRFVDGAMRIRSKITQRKIDRILTGKAVNLGFAKVSAGGQMVFKK